MTTRRRKIDVHVRDMRGRDTVSPVEFGYESTNDLIWMSVGDKSICMEQEQLDALAYLMATSRYGNSAMNKALHQAQPTEPEPYTIHETTDTGDDAEWEVAVEKEI